MGMAEDSVWWHEKQHCQRMAPGKADIKPQPSICRENHYEKAAFENRS